MPASGEIRIIVGASLSRDVEATFGNIAQMAERTGKQVQKAMGGGGGTVGPGAAIAKSFGQAAKASESSSRQIEKDWKDRLKALNAYAKEQEKIAQRTAREEVKATADAAKEIEKILEKETRTKEREAQKAGRAEQRAAEQSARKINSDRERFASRTSQRSVRFLFPNPIGAFGMASRIGGDILRGAGVDFSVAGMVSRAVNAQTIFTQLSNQGYMPGQAGPNGQRVSASTLEGQARQIAQSRGYTTEQVGEAQTKMVDIGGNLAESRAAIDSAMKLSGATGTDPVKMAEAWASVSRHMGDIPDKAAKVEGLMRLIAGQGRVGSIEVKDEAKDLGKIAAVADQFYGDKADIIGQLTGFAQMAKAEGGASSSAQAATSVVAFKNVMTSAPRVKAMLAAGLKEEDIFHMQGTGKNRIRGTLQAPNDIIRKALVATGGDITKFGNIFKSVMAQRATGALVAAYNSDGGHNMAAVNKKINEFGKEATLSSSQVDEAQGERMKTAAAQAVVFQEKLDEVGKSVEAELLPALQQLAPYALQAAHGLGELVTFAAKNPVEAIVAAVAAAIGRASLESTFRAGVEKLILTSLGRAGGGAAAAGVGGAEAAALGGGGTGLTGAGAAAAGIGLGTVAAVVAAAGATITAGYNAIKLLGEISTDVNDPNAKNKKNGGRGGTGTKSQWFWETSKASTPEEYDAMMNKAGLATHEFHGGRAGRAARDMAHLGRAGFGASDITGHGGKLPEVHIDHQALANATMAGIRSVGTLQVNVVNMPASGPVVPGAGRGPDPGTPRPYRH